MAAGTVDVVGSSPISFTNSKGGQQVVPLSALSLSGSDLKLKHEWTSLFDANETTTLLTLAAARVTVGELTPAPSLPPTPALVFTASHAGPESNGITVKVTPEKGTTNITVTATEIDSWSGLRGGDDAAQAIGVDGKPGDPAAGTGLVVVQQGSTGASKKIPIASSGTLASGTPKKANGVDLMDVDNNKVCTILPRADYTGKTALSYEVTIDATATTFTLKATYDSTNESGIQNPVTLQTLKLLPEPVAYLVEAIAPPTGAMVPKDHSVQLSGGARGVAANGLFYT